MMTNNIYSEQNSDPNLILLAAQRNLYSQSKKIHLFRTLFSVIIAIIFPLIYYIIPSNMDICKTIITVIGFLMLMLSEVVLLSIENGKKTNAAKIQEQFDVTLFKLPWNTVLVGDKVTPELIQEAYRKEKGKKSDFQNWYPNTDDYEYPINVLMCQRTNIVWDWRLRQAYANFAIILTIGLIIYGGIIAFLLNSTLTDYFLGILIPQGSALIIGFKAYKNNLEDSKEKKRTEVTIGSIFSQYKVENQPIKIDKCREIQNVIFNNRKSGPLVPNWFYNLLRNKYEGEMKQATTLINI